MLQQLPHNQENFFLREKLNLAEMSFNYNNNSNLYMKEIDNRINEITYNMSVPYYTESKIESKQTSNIVHKETKPQRKQSLTHLFSNVIGQLESFSALYDTKPPCNVFMGKKTSLRPSMYFQALNKQINYSPSQVLTKNVKHSNKPSVFSSERNSESNRSDTGNFGETFTKKSSSTNNLNNFHVKHSQMIYHCSECKINWITGSSKWHECGFNKQYISRERSDFQTPLPAKLMKLVERVSDYTMNNSNLQQVRISVGVTNNLYKTSLQNPHLRNYAEQVYFVFYAWALDQLALQKYSEKEIITGLVNDLMDKGKTDLVFSLWSYDDYSFIQKHNDF